MTNIVLETQNTLNLCPLFILSENIMKMLSGILKAAECQVMYNSLL